MPNRPRDLRIQERAKQAAQVALNCNKRSPRMAIQWLQRDLDRQLEEFEGEGVYQKYLEAHTQWERIREDKRRSGGFFAVGPEPKPPKAVESVEVLRQAITNLIQGAT